MLYTLFKDGFATIGIATLGVGLPESCLVTSVDSPSLNMDFETASRLLASRLSASICQRLV